MSGTHARFIKGKDETIRVQDLSTNGTYINSAKIGKDKEMPASHGDKIHLIRTVDDPKNSVGFQFIFGDSLPSNSASKEKEEEEKEVPVPIEKKVDTGVEELGEEMICCICLDVIYQCVTAIPCLHNFCGGCFCDWMKKSTSCRESFISIRIQLILGLFGLL